MTSSSLKIDSKRRKVFVRLIGEIRHALNEALAEEFKSRKLTRKHIADALGVDKSFVTRKFTGESNMTLETLADFAYALNRSVHVALLPHHVTLGTNIYTTKDDLPIQPGSSLRQDPHASVQTT